MILRPLRIADEDQLRACVRDFAASDPGWDFCFRFDADADFADYVARLERWRTGADVPDGCVPSTYLVADVDGRIVGRVSLRHELDDFLLGYGGHIGFGIVAAERRKGYGACALRLTLPRARALGIDRALLTCADDNAASIRIIESHGGQLEDTRPREGGGVTRRYWIDL